MIINKTIVALSVLAVALTSCGSSEKKEEAPITIKPSTTAIKGDLRDLFTVVDKEYTLTDERYSSTKHLTIEIQRTDAVLEYDKNEIGSRAEKGDKDVKYIAGFGIELLDSLDNVIKVIDVDDWYSPSGESIKSAFSSAAGETTSLEFEIDYDIKPAKFRVISSLRPNVPEEETTTEETIVAEEEETTSDDSSDDLDKTIKQTKEAMEVAGKAAKATKELMDLL